MPSQDSGCHLVFLYKVRERRKKGVTDSNGHGAVYWGKGNPRETLVTFVFLISSTNSFMVVSTCSSANETVARWAMSTNQSDR